MDSMLKDTNYTAELDALRQTTHDAAASDMQTNAQNHGDQGEEDGQVSTSEALDMLRQVGLSYVGRAQSTALQQMRLLSSACYSCTSIQ